MSAPSPVSGSRTASSPLDPKVIMAVRSLELRAKIVVDGFRTGLNRSPRHGFSVEFSEYRQYAQGDDPRFLDWKLYARTDRSYIRLFEDETNLRCCIAADFSRSMSFGSVGYSKHEYSRTIAAALAWMLNRQGDAVGLAVFDSQVREVVPARYRPGQLRRLMVALESPLGGEDTRLQQVLEQTAARLRKRGLAVVLSDFLAEPAELEAGLKLLRGCGHEVIVFQVLDPAELSLDFNGPRLFEDLETGKGIYADPSVQGESFRQRVAAHNAEIKAICERQGALFSRLTTDSPPELALARFLHLRRSVV